MPVDSDFFNNINDAQFTWYGIQYNLDELENFELLRDVAEHNAMFWNSEGVAKIRDARQNATKHQDENFDDTLMELFGKNIKEENPTKPYLDLDLDEVIFTPYGDE